MEDQRMAITPIFEPKEKTEEMTILYCNQVRMGMSVFDITIDFGQSSTTEMTQNKSGQTVVPVDFKTRVVMSPQHAKALAQLLAENITRYEKDFGELHLTPLAPSAPQGE